MSTELSRFNLLKEKINIISVIISDFEIIKNVYVHPISFDWHWLPLNIHELNLDEYNMDTYTDYKQTIHIINNINNNWDYVLFPEFDILNMTLKSNDNYLHCCSIGQICDSLNLSKNKFHWSIVNCNGITLRNIIESIYRLKGSKYNYWTELFHCIYLKQIDNRTLTIEVNFSYGN